MRIALQNIGMKRLFAFFAIIAVVGYFVVREFPRDLAYDGGRLDRMVETQEQAPPYWQ